MDTVSDTTAFTAHLHCVTVSLLRPGFTEAYSPRALVFTKEKNCTKLIFSP